MADLRRYACPTVAALSFGFGYFIEHGPGQFAGDGLSWLIYFNAQIDWMLLLGLFGIAFLVWAMWTAQHSATSPLDLAAAFCGDNGRTSMGKLLGFFAGMAATWAFLHLAVTNKLDAAMFSAYLGFMIAGKVGSEAVARLGKRDDDGPRPGRGITEG